MATDYSELRRLAEAATPQDFDSAEEIEKFKEDDRDMECPYCDGSGDVDYVQYINYDNAALGVTFFGVGKEFVAAEEYYRAAHPAAILALLDTLAAQQAEIERAKGAAERLAAAIWNRQYRDEAPNWELCDSLCGVLSQIDNMTAGLLEENAALRKEVEALRRLLQVAACPDNCIGGAYHGHDGEPVQCQFCYERDMLAPPQENDNG